jgi:ketosteroid isomerase-like protein
MTDEAPVRQMLADYYAAFGTLDMDVITRHFNEPAVLIGAPGVFPAPDRAALAALIASGVEELRSQGYSRSELELRQLTMLSASDALAVGVAVRYKANGAELNRIGVTYVLHRGEAGWKIGVLVMHDPNYA